MIFLPMRRVDVPTVAAIAARCFDVPWDEPAFNDECRRAYAHIRVLRPEDGAAICGFVHLWCVAGEAQVMNIAVLPEFRRRGYGRRLMEQGLALALGAGCGQITLEVRRSNAAALALYERLGFEVVGVRPRYYSDNQEDALVMRRPLSAG